MKNPDDFISEWVAVISMRLFTRETVLSQSLSQHMNEFHRYCSHVALKRSNLPVTKKTAVNGAKIGKCEQGLTFIFSPEAPLR